MSLETKDKDEALKLHGILMGKFTPTIEAKAHALHAGPLLSDIAHEYRLHQLPNSATKYGVPLDLRTLKTYENYLKNFSFAPQFRVPVVVFGHPDEGPRIVREYLAHWINFPKTYNYRLSCLSRLFEYAIEKGIIQRNPTTVIKRRVPKERSVYMTDEHYLAITNKLAEIHHEVYARVCDWLYLMSGRPSNMLDIQEEQILDDGIHYYATKNKQSVVVEHDTDLDELIDWFQSYKRAEGITSPYLIVHPMSAKRGLAGRPITVERLYRYFVDAMEKAHLSGYTLRDLRPKALTDEAEIAGCATNKGVHVTEHMRRHYVKKRLDVRIKNNLKRVRPK